MEPSSAWQVLPCAAAYYLLLTTYYLLRCFHVLLLPSTTTTMGSIFAEGVLAAMRRHSTHAELQETGCRVLEKSSGYLAPRGRQKGQRVTQNAQIRQGHMPASVFTAAGAAAAVGAMMLHPAKREVLLSGSRLLTALSTHVNNPPERRAKASGGTPFSVAEARVLLTKAGACGACIGALRWALSQAASDAQSELRLAAVRALTALTSSESVARQEAADAGCFHLLAETMLSPGQLERQPHAGNRYY